MSTAAVSESPNWVYDAEADLWHCLDDIDPDHWALQAALDELDAHLDDAHEVWVAEDRSFEAWSRNQLGTMARRDAEIARLQGAQFGDMVRFVQAWADRAANEDEAESLAMSATTEIGLALTLAPATVDKHVTEALDLQERLPRTLEALGAGRITIAKARVIAAETIGLTAEETARVEAKLLGLPSEGLRGRQPMQGEKIPQSAQQNLALVEADRRGTRVRRPHGLRRPPQPVRANARLHHRSRREESSVNPMRAAQFCRHPRSMTRRRQ